MYDIILGRSSSDTKKLGTKGTVLIGKQYVQMGQSFSLSNPIYLDVSRAHAMLICGKRGGGKSYTMGSIAEGLADMDPEISKNLAFVLLDTMGVYWSMKYENKKEENLLKPWGLEGKGLNVQIYVPGGFYDKYKEDGVPVDFPFYIQPQELSTEDWMNAFKLGTDDPVGVAIQRVINKLLESKKNFSLDDIIELTEKDERLEKQTKLAVINRFDNCKTWGIFSKNGTKIKDLLTGGKVTVMDLSPYVAMPGGWEVKALTLGIIAKKIFVERMLVRKREELYDIINKTQVIKKSEIKEDLPMPWLIVDEAHEFLPIDETVPSSQALMTILREGRQPGVSLILATQQPGKIHTDAITQSDLVLSHRITASFDLEALDKIFLSYNSKGAKALFNAMPRTKGCAIIMDDKNERLHTMQVKPRITWHGGEDPNAIREIHDEFDLD
ncbi:MAG: ATP-binding protein [Nanoarchaeota archaeon]|nr:ATP-binding protein [Nanoarchaeota archaeon]